MRQLVFHGPGRLEVEEADPPAVGPDEARVAIRAVGVCGSDVHGYAGVNARRVPGMVMGHEAVGTVSELGEDVEGARVVVEDSCAEDDIDQTDSLQGVAPRDVSEDELDR